MRRRKGGIGIASRSGTGTNIGQTVLQETTDTTIALASSSKRERPFLTGVAFVHALVTRLTDGQTLALSGSVDVGP